MTRSLLPWKDRLAQPFEGLSREFEQMLCRYLSGDDGEFMGWDNYFPRTDFAETETEYEVTIDLPGAQPEDLKIELEQGALRVSGEQQERKEEKGKTFRRVERSHGAFQRSLALPGAVEEDKIEAKYTDGVLTVKLPKNEAEKRKRIKVSV